jgi:hypothetical protein
MSNSNIDEIVLKNFFQKDFDLFIDLISKYYPFNLQLLEKYEDKLDWQKLSTNENVEWSISLIDKFAGKLSWGDTYYPCSSEIMQGLLTNSSMPWSVELIREFQNRFDRMYWEHISQNKNIKWSILSLNEFKHKLDWDLIMVTVNPHLIISYIDNSFNLSTLKEELKKSDIYNSFKKNFIWTYDLIETYNDRWFCSNFYKIDNDVRTLELIDKYPRIWDWDNLSLLPWSFEHIKKYEHKWNWGRLSSNKKLPWSDSFIETYKNYWSYGNLAQNESIPWTFDLIEKYQLDWADLQFNSKVLWTAEIIERFQQEVEERKKFLFDLNWNKLSGNPFEKRYNVDWSIELIQRFRNKWDWELLTKNKHLPWSIDLIDKFYFDWSHSSFTFSFLWTEEIIETFPYVCNWDYLSYGQNVEWSHTLIQKFEDKWDWYSLSGNKNLNWTVELIEKYQDKWDWVRLYSNPALPWSVELLQKYDDYWVKDERFGGTDKIELSIEFLENYNLKLYSSHKLWLFFENKINYKLVEYIFDNLK